MSTTQSGSAITSQTKNSAKFSAKVASALDAKEKAFSGFLAQLEEASMDIKNLEKLLNGYGICVPFDHECENLGTYLRAKGQSNEYAFQIISYIRWDEHEDHFRLLYSEAEVPCYKNEQGQYQTKTGFKESFVTSSRPLIETKAKIRLLAQTVLPEFIESLSLHLEYIGERNPF